MQSTETTYTIGQMAEKTGLTRRALRLYEQASLLVPLRDANHYRRYTAQHLQEALVIRDLRASGISVQHIGEIIAIKHTDCSMSQKVVRWLAILEVLQADLIAKQQAIDTALKQLESYRQEALAMVDALKEET